MKRILAVAAFFGLVLTGCTYSGSPFVGAQSGAQSGYWTDLELVQSGEVHPGERETRFPLVPIGADGVPFELWVPYDGPNLVDIVASNEDVPLHAGVEVVAEIPKDLDVFDMFEDGTVLAALDGEAGVWGRDEFEPISSVVAEETTQWLPERISEPNLRAVAGSAVSDVAVWVESSGSAWSLVGWNRDTNVLVELASSHAMDPDTGGHEVILGDPPKVDAGAAYVLFDAQVSEVVAGSLDPGMYFFEWMLNSELDWWPQSAQSAEQSGRADPQSGLASPADTSVGFKVPMRQPGAVEYVASGRNFAVDPEFSGGAYWAAAPEMTDFGTVLEESYYTQVFTRGTGQMLPETQAPTFVVWSDSDLAQPLFGVGPSEDWQLDALAASDSYVAAQVNAAGTDGVWLMIWDLEQEQLAFVVSVPDAADLTVMGEQVIWIQEGEARVLDVANQEISALGQASTGLRVSDGWVALLNGDEGVLARF